MLIWIFTWDAEQFSLIISCLCFIVEIAKRVSREYKDVYKTIKCHVDKIIKQSAYSEVNLTRLFHGLFALKS